jgi:broad specificity phosphatase PhoE
MAETWYEGTRRLQVIRHGATKLNNDDVSVDRIRGWKDIPLSDDGKKEANRLAKVIKADKKQIPDHLFTSDLKRAADTAKIIGAAIDLTAKATRDLRPWNVGDLAGETTEKALPVLAVHVRKKPDEPLPDGESFDDFQNRLFSGLLKILAGNEGVVAIVTHHRCDRALHAWQSAGFPASGKIDLDEFEQKGEATASRDFIDIPMTKLRAMVAQRKTDMAEKKRDWYGNGAKEPTPARHERERTEMHKRHQKRREATHKEEQDDIATMAARHDAEMASEQGAAPPAAAAAPPPAAGGGAGQGAAVENAGTPNPS